MYIEYFSTDAIFYERNNEQYNSFEEILNNPFSKWTIKGYSSMWFSVNLFAWYSVA